MSAKYDPEWYRILERQVINRDDSMGPAEWHRMNSDYKIWRKKVQIWFAEQQVPSNKTYVIQHDARTVSDYVVTSRDGGSGEAITVEVSKKKETLLRTKSSAMIELFRDDEDTFLYHQKQSAQASSESV